MVISTDKDGEMVIMSESLLPWPGYTFSHDLPQQAKTRGHCPISGSTPGYSLKQPAPDLITSSQRFMAPKGVLFQWSHLMFLSEI